MVDARPRPAPPPIAAHMSRKSAHARGSWHAVDGSADMRTSLRPSSTWRSRLHRHRRAQKDRLLGLMHDKDYNFIVQKNRSEWSKLKRTSKHCSRVCSRRNRAIVSMSSLENHFYTNLPAIKSNTSLRSCRWYYATRPDNVPRIYRRGRHRRPSARI